VTIAISKAIEGRHLRELRKALRPAVLRLQRRKSGSEETLRWSKGDLTSVPPRKEWPLGSARDIAVSRQDLRLMALPSLSFGISLRQHPAELFEEPDLEFESVFLQQPVCLSGERRGCTRKAPQFGGILRVAGNVRRDAQLANRASLGSRP
jgi:hypothetical protein